MKTLPTPRGASIFASLASLLLSLVAVTADAGPDTRAPVNVPAAQASSALKDALAAVRVPTSLQVAASSAAARSASGSVRLYKADGERPRMVADIEGSVQLKMDLDFREPMTGKLRIEAPGESFTLSADHGQLTSRYLKTSAFSKHEETVVPLTLRTDGSEPARVVSMKTTHDEVSYATEQELTLAKANGALRLLKDYDKRDLAGGGQSFTRTTYRLGEQEVSLDKLRAFLAKRVVNPPKV